MIFRGINKINTSKRKRNKYVWYKKMFEQRQFGGHFVLCYLDSQKTKIQLGNRAYRIQHTQIMLKSAVFNF